MIKARGLLQGRPMLVVGLSALNCHRLLAGQPISFDTTELGLPGMHVLIVGGASEQEIVADLRHTRLIDESTITPHQENGRR